MARTTVPSAQDWGGVKQAEALIDDFAQQVETFEQGDWQTFVQEMQTTRILD